MSDFTAGFAGRRDAAAQALRHAFAAREGSFAPADLKASAAGAPVHFRPQPATPRHFAPADPDANPTAGWNPFDPAVEQVPAAAMFVDPVAAAHAAGIAEGRAAAHAELCERQTGDRQLLEALADSLRGAGQLDRDRMARQLRETVLFLVTKLVGEIGVAPELLAGRIETATELLADAAESALLRVHPDDVALVQDLLPRTVFAVGDAAVQRGGFVLESASTIVEDGPEMWLEQLAQAIERVAVPGC